MKNLFSTLFLTLAISSPSLGGELLPKGHFHCINRHSAELQTCEKGARFYLTSAKDGRCGCLLKRDIVPASVCQKVTITCNEQGETFATLFTYKETQGEVKEEKAGCGCFSTFSGIHPF